MKSLTDGLRVRTLQEVADQLSKDEGRWCCNQISAQTVAGIERRALRKMRTEIEKTPAMLNGFMSFLKGNPAAIERGAFQPLDVTRHIRWQDSIGEIDEWPDADLGSPAPQVVEEAA